MPSRIVRVNEGASYDGLAGLGLAVFLALPTRHATSSRIISDVIRSSRRQRAQQRCRRCRHFAATVQDELPTSVLLDGGSEGREGCLALG